MECHVVDIHKSEHPLLIFSFDTEQQQALVLPLLENAAQKYRRRKQPLDLILHLLQLDTPFLFIPHSLSPDSTSKSTASAKEAFHRFLVNYIHSNNLAGRICQRVAELMVSCYYRCFSSIHNCIIVAHPSQPF